MRVVDAEVEVLIVGGGPVGLTARALLERWGVQVLLVERHRELSPFPRSRLVNVRSMEIFRRLGLAARIRAAGFAPEYGRVRFRDTLYDRDFAGEAMVGVAAPVPESPEFGVLTSQDRLEPILLAAPGAPVRFGVEVVDVAEEHDGVLATLVDHGRDAELRVRARYLLGADGANSTVRQASGIGTTGPGALGPFTTVVFDADLRWCAEQPAGVYLTAHGTFAPLYPEGGWAWFGSTPATAEPTDWAEVVARALGPAADVKAEVLRVQPWVMNAFVAERFRHGRILLAGDAAHALPIFGGLGMNTGLADVHNLCWKLAGVLHGWADPVLVESYETERLPVAHRTLRQAVANTRLLIDVQNRRRERLDAGVAPTDAVELPWSEQYFAQLGLVLGATYRSGAVRSDGEAAPEPSDADTNYVPGAEPGRRMPHLWLEDGRSTLDAVGECFALLTPDPVRWEQRASVAHPLRIETLPDEHRELCGLGADGAVLVRPDGHVAARWRDGAGGGTTVGDTLATITGRG
ncbi:FAD-dependent monooxygenase [Embleya hyalina]|uniref:FAD-dependent oxidoreductase n=1 Tax=Embleya hyalina TaxID=516124 RepID=A0A401YLU5_9ACTN|nr:FAD-dependent monooxygenase [Embleya hyalina]GCD95584.1 FAD-dependent oxidoreductase [Embleya hyalina]